MKLILTSMIGDNRKPIFKLCRNTDTKDNCNIELNFTNKTVSIHELKESLKESLKGTSFGINLLSIIARKKDDGVTRYRIIKKKRDEKVIDLELDLINSEPDLLDIDETFLIDFYPDENDEIRLTVSPNIEKFRNIIRNISKKNPKSETNNNDIMTFVKKFEISPGEYLKNELDNNFRKQIDNISKLFYKLGFTNQVYSILDSDNKIEFDEKDNVRTKDLSQDYISTTLIPAIKKYNREFSKELLLSAYSDYIKEPEIIPNIVRNKLYKIGQSKINEGDALIQPVAHSSSLINIGNNLQKEISVMSGGNKKDFRKVRNILELVAEPKHDFGKGPTSRASAISHKINTAYDGTISGEKKNIQSVKDSLKKRNFFGKIFNSDLNFDNLLTGSHEAKLLHTLSFIKKYHIDIDESTEKGKLTQLHTFFRFYRYIDDNEFIESSSNQGGQLYRTNYSDIFKRVFKANIATLGIKHFVFDTGAGIDFLGSTGGVKDELKSTSRGLNPGETLEPINLIVPLVNIWDPATASINNFNLDILKGYASKDEQFIELLKTTYLENNTESTNDIWFPKRDSISKYYSVRYNEDHDLSADKKPSKSPPIILTVKTRADDIENLEEDEYTEIELMGGYSVDNLSRAMKCIVDDRGDISKLEAVPKSTKAQTDSDTQRLRQLVTALNAIPFDDYKPETPNLDDIRVNDSGKVASDDLNKLRVRILLDMKKSGDWSQVKWVRRINMSFPKKHKTMFISGDNLCALMAILNGIPTIFGSTGMEKLESGGHISAKLLSFYTGSPSKLTINEISQFQIYVDNQLGVQFLTPQYTLKQFSDIEASLKEKYPIFELASFNTPIRSMVNNAKMSDSSMPDFLLYKLTTESDTELNEPSESLMDKSVFQLLFDDESKIIRKHLLDISNFKLQLVRLNQGLVSESEIDKLEPTILNQIGIVKGLLSVFISSNEFIKTNYDDIALKTDNIARCINVINSDLIFGDSGGPTQTISKPHVDEINKLCGIHLEYGEAARTSIVQRRSLKQSVTDFKKTFTLNLAEELEEASRLVSDDGEKIPVKEMSIEQMEQTRTTNFCDEVYGKPTTRHWFRSSGKILTLMQNMSSIMSKVLEVSSMNDIYVRLVALYNNITGILSDINLFSEITAENETDTMWIKNVFLSSIEMGYHKLLGLKRAEESEPRPPEKLEEDEAIESEINDVQINLAQITTNLECLLVGMNKFSSVIMNQLGNSSEMKDIFNSYVEVLESQETTFAEMFKMFNAIQSRGFIQTLDKSFTEELRERTVIEEDILDESHLPLVEEMATDESVKLSDIIDSKTIDIESEEVFEIPDEEVQAISTPERNIIMQLQFIESSKSKFRIYNNLRVKILRLPKKAGGLHRVELIEGEEKGKIILILGRYVKPLPSELPLDQQPIKSLVPPPKLLVPQSSEQSPEKSREQSPEQSPEQLSSVQPPVQPPEQLAPVTLTQSSFYGPLATPSSSSSSPPPPPPPQQPRLLSRVKGRNLFST